MSKSLGPWTTAIDSGATLSAFWRHRMTRLPELARTSARLSRRSAVLLALATVTTLGWPTAHLTLEVATADPPPKSDEQPAAGDNTKQPGQVFSVELNDGVRAEILGLCEHPSKGKAWWAADGRPIAAPYQLFHSTANNPNATVREIAMMMHVPKGADIAADWSPVGASAYAGGLPEDAQGKPLRAIDAAAIALPPNLDTTVIKLSVAAGPWITMAQTDGRSWASEGRKKHGYVYTPAIEADGKVTISIAHNVLNRDLRIVAIGDKGQILANGGVHGGGAANFRQTTGIFENVSLKDIREFQLQVRPYHKYEIQNVSLHRDRHTVPTMIDLGVDEEEK
jgi:hypothetical protein